jgi:hypothetical protein
MLVLLLFWLFALALPVLSASPGQFEPEVFLDEGR